MAERPQGYGMTAEIRAKVTFYNTCTTRCIVTYMSFMAKVVDSVCIQLDAKHDPVLEAQARDWLEAVVGESFPNGSFQEALRDGVYLCKAINVLDPNKNIKINTSKMAFKQVGFSIACDWHRFCRACM